MNWERNWRNTKMVFFFLFRRALNTRTQPHRHGSGQTRLRGQLGASTTPTWLRTDTSARAVGRVNHTDMTPDRHVCADSWARLPHGNVYRGAAVHFFGGF